MGNETCSYCGVKGHWRPDCPEIGKLVVAARAKLALRYIPVEEALPSSDFLLVATDGLYEEVGFYSQLDRERHAAGGPVDEWVDFHFIVRGWFQLPENPWREK